MDGFDKKDWLRELKQLRKDYTGEDRERYRPLLNVRRELPDFLEEVEKEEKRAEITVRKEFSAVCQVIRKHRQDVD
jgi:hypothetical protein